MDVYQLEVFRAVYQNRSFSRASGKLNITQPAVSANIKKLEDELGVRLFDRTGRKTIPTAEAELLYERAGEIIDKLNDIRTGLGSADGGPSGMISIGAVSIAGSYVLPALCAEFSRMHPDVRFQVDIEAEDIVLARLRDGGLMLAVVVDEPMGPLFSLSKVEDELVLVCAPGFLKQPSITPLKLLSIPLIVREERSEARQSMRRQHLLHKISLKALNVVAEFGSTEGVREAAKRGHGAAILSRFSVRDELETGLLEKIDIKGVSMRRAFHLIANESRTLPPAYQAFVDFFLNQAPKL